MNNKAFVNLEMFGETLVVVAAAIWLMRLEWVPIVFAVGAVLMSVGRFTQFHADKDLALSRLYKMRKLGCIMLLISAALMFVKGTKYLAFGMYLFPSSWLIFFVIFVVIEVYTTIRILNITKEK